MTSAACLVYLEVAQRLAVQNHAFSLSDRIVNVEALLTQEIIRHVEALKVKHHSAQSFDGQILALVYHLGDRSGDLGVLSTTAEKVVQLVDGSVVRQELGFRSQRDPSRVHG